MLGEARIRKSFSDEVIPEVWSKTYQEPADGGRTNVKTQMSGLFEKQKENAQGWEWGCRVSWKISAGKGLLPKIRLECGKIFQFYSFFKKFYWHIVDFQCCSSKCTAQWFSVLYIYIYISLCFRFFSHIGFSDCWLECSVLYSRFLLITYFIYICMCMLIPSS